MRKIFGVCFLLIQLGFIFGARFSEARYFCWAPHDMQVYFELEVRVGSKFLTDQEIFDRYRLPKTGRNPRAAEHIKRTLMQYEQTYGRSDPAQIVMHYKINGKPQAPWVWPFEQ